MEKLKNKIYILYDLNISYSLEEYNDLIKQCCDLYEMSAVVFLYDNMKYHKIIPSNDTFKFINKLHGKKCQENNDILIKDNGIKKLTSRRRIHKIIKGYNYRNALKDLELVKSYIELHQEIINYDKIKLAKYISKKCNIPFINTRYIITNLIKKKFIYN